MIEHIQNEEGFCGRCGVHMDREVAPIHTDELGEKFIARVDLGWVVEDDAEELRNTLKSIEPLVMAKL